MALPEPEPGLVISYSYLWHQESLQGRMEGSKDRPAAIIICRQKHQGDTEVLVAPITHSEPGNPNEGIEIPDATRKRLGLSDEGRSWVILTEMNRFVWPGPDIRPIHIGEEVQYDYGMLPPKLFEQLKERLISLNNHHRVSAVKRTD